MTLAVTSSPNAHHLHVRNFICTQFGDATETSSNATSSTSVVRMLKGDARPLTEYRSDLSSFSLMFNSERLRTVVVIANVKLGSASGNICDSTTSDTHKTQSMDVKGLPTIDSVKLRARTDETACTYPAQSRYDKQDVRLLTQK